jgi:hypothetical protein
MSTTLNLAVLTQQIEKKFAGTNPRRIQKQIRRGYRDRKSVFSFLKFSSDSEVDPCLQSHSSWDWEASLRDELGL